MFLYLNPTESMQDAEKQLAYLDRLCRMPEEGLKPKEKSSR